MKISHFILIITLILVNTTTKSEPVILDEIAITVNDSVITKSQINKMLTQFLRSLPIEQRDIPLDNIRKQIYDSLINEELKVQEAKKHNITIDNVTVNREMEKLASRKKITVEQLYKNIANSGISITDYREKLRREIAIQQLFSRVIRSRVRISEQEITDYLNSDLQEEINSAEFNLSHIVINITENANSEAIEKADEKINKIYDELLNGQSFNTSAREYSDSETGLNGGKLGWLNRADLPSRFMQIILEMTDNNISKPFKTSAGFNILKLNDIRGMKKHIVDEVNVRHILIKKTALIDDTIALDKITKIRASIIEGADFGKLAKESSDDPGSASNNGKLGWGPSDTYVPEFKKLADELPTNKLSQPIKTQFGWHILEVLGRRNIDKTIERIRNIAHNNLVIRKAEEEEQRWTNELRSRAYVVILDEHKK